MNDYEDINSQYATFMKGNKRMVKFCQSSTMGDDPLTSISQTTKSDTRDYSLTKGTCILNEPNFFSKLIPLKVHTLYVNIHAICEFYPQWYH